MRLANATQNIAVGLIAFIGVLILAGTASWIGCLIYGMFNPERIRPMEDWSLLLGALALLLMIASLVETLVFSLLTRFQWLPYTRGMLGVGTFSAIALMFALVNIGLSSPISAAAAFPLAAIVLSFSFIVFRGSRSRNYN